LPRQLGFAAPRRAALPVKVGRELADLVDLENAGALIVRLDALRLDLIGRLRARPCALDLAVRIRAHSLGDASVGQMLLLVWGWRGRRERRRRVRGPLEFVEVAGGVRVDFADSVELLAAQLEHARCI